MVKKTGEWALGEVQTAHSTVFLTIYALATIRSRSIETAVFGVLRRRFNSKDNAMSRRCDLTGKGALVGHKVSHSNIKTKRRFLPNLLNVTMISDTLGRSVKLKDRKSTRLNSSHRGGLDAFLKQARNEELSPKALKLKQEIAKKTAAAKAA